MEIASSCPFPVTSVVWQSHSGGWALTLVCKATFRLDAPEAVLADQQESFNDEDNHWNDDPARSLVAPSDLVPFKPRADVLVVGHAFAADRMPVRTLTACITVGQMSKALEVWCDRWFDMEGRVHEGSRFVKMPLRWERAAGGPDSVNPVGLRFDAEPDAYGRVMIPNLQPLGAHVGWRGDRFDPVGFGPIAPHWPARRGRLHGHAAGFSLRDLAKQPLPAIDFGYFNAAPLDQQVDAIRADERITLEHLHRDQARFVTRLPGLHPRATVDRAGGREELRLMADTLWIDTDRAVCTVVWRGGIGLHSPRDAGTIHVTIDGAGRTTASSAAVATLSLRAPPEEARRLPESDPTVTLAPGLEHSPETTLPFMQSRWVESPYAHSDAEPPSEGTERPPNEAGETLFLSPAAVAATTALPFPSHATLDRGPRAAEAMASASAPDAAAPAVTARPLVPLESSLAGSSSPTMAPESTAAAPPKPPSRNDEARAGLLAMVDPPSPPARIGPLARMHTEVSAPVSRERRDQDATADVTAPRRPAPQPPATGPELERYPIERCAKIAVCIACRPGDTARTLEEHGLSSTDWNYVKAHWLEAIRRELGHGRNSLLMRYDLAYVEQLEVERGPVDVEVYAKLAVAAERGKIAEVVGELGFPIGTPIRVERVWAVKMATDPALGRRVADAVDQRRAM